jgi:hypothetical protein
MTTLDILVVLVVIIGGLNLYYISSLLSKLRSMDKVIKRDKVLLNENRGNMVKVAKLITILMRRTQNMED